MAHPFITIRIDIELCSERYGVQLLLCPLVDDCPVIAIDWGPVCIGFDKVLIDFGPDVFKKIA